jgi:hypothetical protein
MLQVFYLRCCICCTGYIRMLQVYVSNVGCKYFIWMSHMLQCPYTYVASICCKCFICFRRMLQVFHEQAWQEGAEWSPRARRPLCARGKQSEREAQSCILGCDSKCGARSYIYVQVVGAEHEVKRSTKLHHRRSKGIVIGNEPTTDAGIRSLLICTSSFGGL